MPFDGLRPYLETLEKKNLLKWVDREVDREWEIGTVTRMMFRAMPEERRVGIGFRNIRGFPGGRVVTGVVAASVDIIATALECEPNAKAINERVHRGIKTPIPTVMVKDGAVQGGQARPERARSHQNPDAGVDAGQGRRPLFHAAVGDARSRHRAPQSRHPPLPGEGAEQDRHPVRRARPRRRHPSHQVEDARPVDAGGVLRRRRSGALPGRALALRRGRAGGRRRHPRRAGRDGEMRDRRPRSAGQRRVRGRGRGVDGARSSPRGRSASSPATWRAGAPARCSTSSASRTARTRS